MDMISAESVAAKILQIEESFMCNCRKSVKTTVLPKTQTQTAVKPADVAVVADPAITTRTATEPVVIDTIPAKRPDETRSAYLKRLKAVVSSPSNAKGSVAPREVSVEDAAKELALDQCYLCAKKHIGRAQSFFEEYHTGYDDRVKRLIESLRVAEGQIQEAFLLKERTQAQLDMAAGELLGGTPGGSVIDAEHVRVANLIRDERLNLQDDSLYVPNFDKMLIEVQKLQYSE
jgi:hypothetical protein